MKKKRRYRMTGRAESQDATRRKIIEATMRLHEEVGPRATTISAIASKAGVQRLTVYRHFPDEQAVFEACTSHWLELNPPPQPVVWASVADPSERAMTAVRAFFRYYSSTQRMWRSSHRDAADVPALARPMAQFSEFVNSVANDLAAAMATEPGAAARLIATTLQHALAFSTWEDLERRGLKDEKKIELVTRWIEGARARGAVAH
jgi:AcrR family transcriptional regulator